MENDNRYSRTNTQPSRRRAPSEAPTSRQQRVAPSLRSGSTSAVERTSQASARTTSGRYAQTGTRSTSSQSASRYSQPYTRTASSSRTASPSRTSAHTSAPASSRVQHVEPETERRQTAARTTQSVRSNSAVARTTEPRTSSAPVRNSSSRSSASRTESVTARTRTQSSSAPARTRTQSESVPVRPRTSSAPARTNTTAARTRTSSAKKNSGFSDFVSGAKDKLSTARDNAKVKAAAREKANEGRGGFFGLPKFTRFIIIYSAAFVVLIVLVAIILSSYLKSYESEQPSHVIEDIVEDFSSSDSLKTFLDKNNSVIKGTESVLNFEDSYYGMVEGKEISYVSDNSKTSMDISAYNITADGAPVANVELTKDGNSWDLTAVDISVAYKDLAGYSILVPDGATVSVNGNELGESSIVGTGVPAILEYSSQFLKNTPEFTTYEVKAPSGENLDVSGTDSNGNPLNFSNSGTTYVAGDGADQSFIDEVKDRVEKGVEEYALYFEFLAFDLENYVLEGSELHKFIFGSEDFDPINPGLYMYEYINTSDFKEKSVTNYTVYGDECFTVDVKYDLLITFNTEGPYGTQNLDDDEITMDATWVWVKQGDNWYIAEIVSH